MIRAVISENAEGRIEGFRVSGHAGYAEPGADIICSAVSAVVYTVLGYIDEVVAKQNGSKVFYEESDGFIRWERSSLIPSSEENLDQLSGEKLDAVLQAMVIGLTQIRKSYGKKYLSIQFEEVRFSNGKS